ncbi:MAG: isoprenylcysteine carboxylmethyltransferase family protein [Hyphomicrobiales bacterium]|nr:isoprenylcysteine carboxylmethyltransferase family protein [Hyphomicrobiales bacterium]
MSRYGERPNTIPWPPILFFGALTGAALLSRFAPLAMPWTGAAASAAGLALILAGFGLMLWAFATFRRARTTVLPHQRSDALITIGPFRRSRNPIYLAEAVILAGLALYNAAPWHALVIPPFMMAVTRLGIMREEAHLLARFGEAWRAYAARVRRWL